MGVYIFTKNIESKRHVNSAGIVFAGGVGVRMQKKTPKQFLEIEKKPLLFRSLEPFYRFLLNKDLEMMIVVAPAGFERRTANLLKKLPVSVFSDFYVITGGATRLNSYFNATRFISENFPKVKIVVTHDANRPLATADMVQSVFAAVKHGADVAINTAPVNESVFGIGATPLDRKKFFLGQTPYAFKFKFLLGAKKIFSAKASRPPDLADIIFLMQKLKPKIKAMSSGDFNLKITHPHDIAAAEFLLKTKKFQYRKTI